MDYKDKAITFVKLINEVKQHNHMKDISQNMAGARWIMQLLYKHKSLTPGEISKKLQITTARVAAILNALEDKKIIIRKIDPKDRRKIIVSLTEDGLTKSQEHKEKMLDQITDVLLKLGKDDTDKLLDIVAKVNHIIEEKQLQKGENKNV